MQEADRKRSELEERIARFEEEARVAMAALARSEQQVATDPTLHCTLTCTLAALKRVLLSHRCYLPTPF